MYLVNLTHDCQHFVVHLAKVLDLIQHCYTIAHTGQMEDYSQCSDIGV